MTRKGRLALCLLVVATVLAGAVALFFFFPGLLPISADSRRDSLNQEEIARLRTGDVVLRKGVSSASDLITSLVGEGFGLSHCGLIVLRDGKPWVIHTLNGSLTGMDGVQTQSLHDFFSLTAPDTLVLVRPKMEAAGIALSLEAAEGFLATAQPFDNAYNLEDRSQLYCSELLTSIFESGGLFVPGQDYPKIYQYLSFSLFFDSRYFEPILSHNSAATAQGTARGFLFPLE